MPKNKRGGNKHRRSKKTFNSGSRKPQDIARKKSDDELYGLVTKALGNRRFSVKCQPVKDGYDYSEVNCGLKGSCDKFIKAGMYVLVQNWEFHAGTTPKGTIIDAYTSAEVRKMDACGLWDYDDKVERKDDIIEFIDEEDARERDLERDKAIERLGPKNITQLDELSDDDDLHAI